ncbi:ABC transporter substrate-binding protein [Streptomyces sp. NBC_01803]|uniref:ABC transporter substrate-binding protein n=1 Tax=Streptomyces sp. NBC_01803 TaxID=2975946 RepID=UPI002DD8FA61|nr:spermidine/putrescine ABC transporter substrate-binding protein [Streptomyces sp. NBC_01803]WSA43314.1 spermidine/putrescine ABC transporter substrate-binding protein [Streptomyces sp. NBC_01803]
MKLHTQHPPTHLRVLCTPAHARRLSTHLSTGLSRRRFLLAAGAGTATATLSGCFSAGEEQTTGSDVESGQPIEDALLLANYADYVSEENLRLFTEAEGPRVTLETYVTGVELISKMDTGGAEYDIVVPGPAEVVMLRERGLLAEINRDLIPNLANLPSSYEENDYDPGNRFTIPKNVGLASFWYRPSAVPDENPQNLLDCFEMISRHPDARVNFFAGAREVFAIALAALDRDIATTDPADIQAAKELLISVQPHIDSFGADEVSLGSAGEIDICLGYNGYAHLINQARPEDPVTFVLPTGSTEYFMNVWAIPTNAPHPVAAHRWINMMLEPEAAGREMDFTGYLVPVTGAERFADPALIADPVVSVTPEQLARWQVNIPTPESVSLQTEAFNEFRAA